MYEGMKLFFSEPICGCKYFNLGFSVENNSYIKLVCKSCNIVVAVPIEFKIDHKKPYPFSSKEKYEDSLRAKEKELKDKKEKDKQTKNILDEIEKQDPEGWKKAFLEVSDVVRA